VRALKIHLLLIGRIRAAMPLFNKAQAQRKILDSLPEIYYEVHREHQIPMSDFPDIHRFRESLSALDFRCGRFGVGD